MRSRPDEAREIFDDLVEHYERFLSFGVESFPLGQLCEKVENLQRVFPMKLAPRGYILPGIPAGGDDRNEFTHRMVPLDFMRSQIERIREQLEAST